MRGSYRFFYIDQFGDRLHNAALKLLGVALLDFRRLGLPFSCGLSFCLFI
jgi:hypothetical protein